MKKKNKTTQNDLSFMQGEKWENESPEYKKWFLYYDKKYTLASKRRMVTAVILAALLIGGGVGTSVYFATRGGTQSGEVTPDPRTPTLIDESEKFEITEVSRSTSGITFKVEPKDGTTHCDRVVIKIENTTLSSEEYTFKDSVVTIPSSTLKKYNGHISVEPKFDDKTEVYFKYSSVHIDATDDTSFIIPYETTDSGKLEWSCDNDNFVSIDKNTGAITLQKEAVEGTTVELKVTITVTAVESTAAYKSDQCTLIIVPTTNEILQFVATKGENYDGYAVKAKSGATLTGDIVVPGVYEGKPVVSVNGLGFYGQTGITSINLPESVTSIGTMAFNGCSNLAKINLPKAMFSIGTSVFTGTSDNLAITFENKNSTWSVYQGTTVKDTIVLTDYTETTIAAKIKDLDSTYNLARNGVEDPESNLMYYMTSEITCSVAPKNSNIEGEVIIPATVTFADKTYEVNAILYDTINKASSFKGCSKITKIYIPSTIEYITKTAFSTCSKLEYIDVNVKNPYFSSSKGILYTKDFGTLLCYPCSYGGEGTTGKIELPAATSIIEASAFANSNIEEFCCAEGSALKTVNVFAFSYCASLKTVKFPASLTFVDWKVFLNSANVESISFDDTTGWSYYSGGTPDLTDPSANATNFTNYGHSCCNDGVVKK